MADKTTKFKTKSVYFTEVNFNILDFAVEQSELLNKSFSDYIIDLIKEKKDQGGKLPEYMKRYLDEYLEKRIKDIAGQFNTITKEDATGIKEELDPEVIAAMNQFDNL